MTSPYPIPEAYDGREQALVKHELLKSYLLKLFHIVGMGAGRGQRVELCYIDCFAGPWGDDSVDFKSTSIAISLEVLRACKQRLVNNGVQVTIRALYVEKSPRSFKRLDAYLKNKLPSGIQTDCMHGDFVDLREKILEWAGRDAFTFFFIDPKGWKDIGVPTLRKVLQRPRSEFLINFMYDFVNRTASMSRWKEEMTEVLGGPVDLEGMLPRDRERILLRTYRENLKKCLPSASGGYQARSAYVRVMDPDKNRPKYHLVYLTRHPRGLIEFMDISAGVELVQKQIRGAKKEAARERNTGMADMFDSEPATHSRFEPSGVNEIEQFWIRYLRDGERKVAQNEFAAIIEENDWFPGELQAALVNLIDAGIVRNLDAISKRPKKPLHYEVIGGERLILLQDQSEGLQG